MTERYCLHCELGRIVTLRLEEGVVTRDEALGYAIQVAANLIEVLPAERRFQELMRAVKFFVEMVGGSDVTTPTMRH